MSIDQISSMGTMDLTHAAKNKANVINSEEIKSILYLGINGGTTRKAVEGMRDELTHTVDTFV